MLEQLQLMTEWVMSCSFTEIYNESFRDLLNPGKADIIVREDKKGRMIISGVKEVLISEESLKDLDQSCED